MGFVADPTEIDSDEEHYNPNRPYDLPPSERYSISGYKMLSNRREMLHNILRSSHSSVAKFVG